MTTKSIAIERRDRVQIIALHRPEHGNRVSQTMAEEITAAIEQSRRDPTIVGTMAKPPWMRERMQPSREKSEHPDAML